MERRSIDLKRISCKGVKTFLPLQKPSLYAAVSVVSTRSDPKHRLSHHKTALDPKGGENPEWDQPFRLYLEPVSDNPDLGLALQFHLKDRIIILGDRLVGTVLVPIANLSADGDVHHASYQVKSDGKPNGSLSFSYKMGDSAPGPKVPDPDPMPASGSDYPSVPLGDLMGIHLPPPPPSSGYYPPTGTVPTSSFPPEPPVTGGFYPAPSYYPPTAPVSSEYYPTPSSYPPEPSVSGGLYPQVDFYPPESPVPGGMHPTSSFYPPETPVSSGYYATPTPSCYPPEPPVPSGLYPLPGGYYPSDAPFTGGCYPPPSSYPPQHACGSYNAPADSFGYREERWNSRRHVPEM